MTAPSAYISHDGIAAAVEGCALAPRDDGGYWLWYLSIIGSAREAVRSVWAGLLATPPKATTIMLPANPPHHGLVHSGVWAAPKTETDGWHSVQPLKLPNSAAYQMVMLPRIALVAHVPQRPTEPPQPSAESQTGAPAPPVAPFILLDTPERATTHVPLAAYFLHRLNTAIDIPLLPHWADWAWNTALTAGWITPLICGGSLRTAFLCRVDRAAFAAALTQAIANKSLHATPDTRDVARAAALPPPGSHETDVRPIPTRLPAAPQPSRAA